MAIKSDSSERPAMPMALAPWQFYLLTGIAALALVLVFVTTSLSGNITSIRRQLDERQSFINETMLLSRLNVQLAQVMANLAVATGDRELKELLEANGITFRTDVPDARNRARLAPGAAASLGDDRAKP